MKKKELVDLYMTAASKDWELRQIDEEIESLKKKRLKVQQELTAARDKTRQWPREIVEKKVVEPPPDTPDSVTRIPVPSPIQMK